MPARGHTPDEHAGVPRMRLHADPIAEDRAAGERARGIHCDDADGLAAAAQLRDQAIDERALPRSGRSGDADDIGPAGLSEQPPQHIRPDWRVVFDERDRARERPRIAGPDRRGQRAAGHWASNWRAITSRWISLVPSPMVRSLTSRKYFSAG